MAFDPGKFAEYLRLHGVPFPWLRLIWNVEQDSSSPVDEKRRH